MATLLPCPFCGGSAVLEQLRERAGYGEYESLEIYRVVVCSNCHAHGKRYHQKHLIQFTSATVADFRNNPILRAKVEDEYDAYCAQTKELAIAAWQQRVG